MFDHPPLLLVMVRRNQKTGGNTTGLGGPNDPMA